MQKYSSVAVCNNQISVPISSNCNHFEECLMNKLFTNTTMISPSSKCVGKPGKWNPNCCCLFSSLPHGVLVNIQSYLPLEEVLQSCALVCTRWRAVSQSPLLYNSISFNGVLNSANLDFLHYLLKSKGKHMVTLKIIKGKSLTNETFSLIEENASNIRNLTITHASQTSSEAMDRMLINLPLLSHVNFFGVSSFTDSSLEILSNYKIKSLNIACTTVTTAGLNLNLNKSSSIQNLETLDIQGCMHVKNINDIIPFATSLSTLKLNGSGVIITDTLATLIGKHCLNLSELLADSSDTFLGNQLFSNTGLNQLSKCLKLIKLHIRGSTCLSNTALSSLQHLPLEDLDISYCSCISKESLEAFLHKVEKTLKNVSINDMDLISTSEAQKISKVFKGITFVY